MQVVGFKGNLVQISRLNKCFKVQCLLQSACSCYLVAGLESNVRARNSKSKSDPIQELAKGVHNGTVQEVEGERHTLQVSFVVAEFSKVSLVVTNFLIIS